MCSDPDFENALQLVTILKRHALQVYWRLPKPKTSKQPEDTEVDDEKARQKRECKELHQQGLTYREISVRVFGTETKHQTVYRWIHK